ncbi:nicotinate-nucleotide adenylyltransferase [Bacteroides heparinolyticus]|uniref:nicotinate-nucleotide adenylyltransferase n=1 Tax=Prevotella heparinolytica TaxID=28113 RepID=UPI0035A0EC2D
MKIGILGGTFDPVHKAHIEIALAAQRELSLDEVWFMPSYHPPHKANTKISSYEERLDMLELALLHYPQFKICELEAGRSEHSYTSVSLALVRKMYPTDEFYFIMGADSLFEIKTWYQYEKIFSLATLVVIDRAYEQEHEELRKLQKEYENLYQCKIFILNLPQINISSTEIRGNIKKNLFQNTKNNDMIDERVLEYIKEKQLYIS